MLIGPGAGLAVGTGTVAYMLGAAGRIAVRGSLKVRGSGAAVPVRAFAQALAQAVPLRVNCAGTAFVPVYDAWKPNCVLPPAGIVAL